MSEIILSLRVSRPPDPGSTEERITLQDANNNGRIDAPSELRSLALLLRGVLNDHRGERITFRLGNGLFEYGPFPEFVTLREAQLQAGYLAAIYNGQRR